VRSAPRQPRLVISRRTGPLQAVPGDQITGGVDAEAIRAWKSSPEFKERLGQVVKQASKFEPTEQVTLVKVAGGTGEAFSSPKGIEAILAPT
jgi:hypothetical protein